MQGPKESRRRDAAKAALSAEVVPISALTIATESLLSELTLEEKVSLLSGVDFRTTPGVPRLNIPRLMVCDLCPSETILVGDT